MKSKKICALISLALLTTSATPAFAATTVTPSITAGDVKVVNNFVGNKDTITLKGADFKSGDTIKVYNTATKTKTLGTGTADGSADVVISVDQVGQAAGSVYVTNTTSGDTESTPVAVSFTQEETPKLDTSKVTVNNNVDKADTVAFTGLTAGEIVKVYAKDGTTKLGTGTATSAGAATVTLAAQLKEGDLEVEVSGTVGKAKESAQEKVTYSTQAVSADPSATVTNNVDKLDVVTFAGVKKGDKAIVYAKDATTILGSAVALADGDLKVTLPKQLSETDLEVEAALKTPNKMMSAKKQVTYTKQTVSADPSVTVTNNVDKLDTVTFASVKKGDKASVYAKDGKTLLGSKVALADGDLTFTLAKQLSETDLEIEATLKTPNQQASAQKPVTYTKQDVTTAPKGLDVLDTDGKTVKTAGDTVLVNNVDTKDTITVKGLKAKDVVTIYGSDGTTKIGAATAVKDGDVTVTLVKQLDETTKKAFVTVKNYNKMASEKTELDYAAQKVTAELDSKAMFVTNNAVIAVGLTAGDKVSVYSTADATKPVATAIVAKGNTYVVIANIKDVSGKTLYIANKSKNQMESKRTSIAFQ